MLDKLINRRRALSFLPAIGGGLCLPSLLPAASSPRVGLDSRDVALLPFTPPSEWHRAALVGFGQSGYDLLAEAPHYGLNWSGNKYLALNATNGCCVPGVVRLAEAVNVGADGFQLPRHAQSLVVLAGDLLDNACCEMARIVAHAARKAGHVVAIVPAAPRDRAIGAREIAYLFASDAACIVVSSASMRSDDTDQFLRTMVLQWDLLPFALALEKWGSAGIATRIAARPGSYKVERARECWSSFERPEPDLDRLIEDCFERIGVGQAELLSFSASPLPPRRKKSIILRAAHRLTAPAKPLITMKGEGYYIGEGYSLTLNALVRFDNG